MHFVGCALISTEAHLASSHLFKPAVQASAPGMTGASRPSAAAVPAGKLGPHAGFKLGASAVSNTKELGMENPG